MHGQPRGRVHITEDDRDTDAITRVLAGDADAYAEIVSRHVDVARRAAIALGARDEADDVVQEAFVKAYRTLGRFRQGSAFRPWLLRIVANEARNLHRTRQRRDVREQRTAQLDERLVIDATDPSAELLGAERRRELVEAMQALPEQQRMAVVCRYLLDLDEREAAAVLRCRPGTVKSRLHRGLARLRAELDSPDLLAADDTRQGRP